MRSSPTSGGPLPVSAQDGSEIQIIEESSGQRFSKEEKKIEESSDQRFSEEEKKRFVEASGGRASVGSNDRSGGHKHRIGNDQINEEFSEEEMKQFASFEEDFRVLKRTGQKIQKVPPMLRDNNKFKRYFEPKMFSFGPYKRTTHNRAKQIKVNLAANFLQQNDVKKEDLYRNIKDQIKELKDCYDDDLTHGYEDHKLAWMFLVDGCAVLQFMYIFVESRSDPEMQNSKLRINYDYEEFLAQDLFLLENQLPYKLLQLIIRGHRKENEFLKSIYEFIFHRFRIPEEWPKNINNILEGDLHSHRRLPHHHLLDLLWTMLTQPLHQIGEKSDLIETIFGWTFVLFDKMKCNRNKLDQGRFLVPLPNIGKLREAGINLKCSKTNYVGDISFNGGTLKLPGIILDESTTTIVLNMLGYEMCPDISSLYEVSTYMYFLDKLVDRTQDVEELREKNILLHDLGSDEEVVGLLNEISKYVCPNVEYYIVKRKIEDYFDNKGLIWLHKVSHDIHQHFKGRWSLLAFIGALLAVASSIIQTAITVQAYQANPKKGN